MYIYIYEYITFKLASGGKKILFFLNFDQTFLEIKLKQTGWM